MTLIFTAGVVWAWLAGALDCRFFPSVAVETGVLFWLGTGCYLMLLLLPAFWAVGEQMRLRLVTRRWKQSWKEETAHDLL